MEVILARHNGFCYGVKRAIKLAQDSAALEGTACTLGPIIHNPQMVERLNNEGIGMVDTLQEMTGDTIIIRSHGVGPQVYEEAEGAGLQIVDATCPHVKKAQMAAYSLSEENYQVVIVGEKKHPEVKSIFEWSGHKAEVVETVEQAAQIKTCLKLGIVVQTTFSGEEFKKIVNVLIEKSNDIKIARTICTATDQRQKAAIELSQEVDIMIVIGGKNSANTTRLAQLCSNAGCKTYHIETVQEIEPGWFDGIHKVGISAGASTPDWIIKEVYEKVQNMESLLEEQDIKKIQEDDIIKGTVVLINHEEIFVDIGYKAEISIPKTELAFPIPENIADVVQIGDELDLYVVSIGGETGVVLSKVKADKILAWDKIKNAFKAKEKLETVVLEAVKGGLVTAIFGLSGFIPASQIDLKFIEDLSVYIGQTLLVLPIEIDPDKQRIVLSRRVLLEAERNEKQTEIFEHLAVGQVIRGSVKRLADYGAFIDIGGIDGLAHISDLSWERVTHPSEVLTVGEQVDVFVKSFDIAAKRISLSVKDTIRDPWFVKVEQYKEGSYVKGKVSKIAEFGVFLTIGEHLDGLIHLKELSEKRITKAEEVVHLDEELNVKIIHIDKKNKRIALSLIQAQQDAERAEYTDYISEQTETTNTLGDQFGDLFKNFSDK